MFCSIVSTCYIVEDFRSYGQLTDITITTNLIQFGCSITPSSFRAIWKFILTKQKIYYDLNLNCSILGKLKHLYKCSFLSITTSPLP